MFFVFLACFRYVLIQTGGGGGVFSTIFENETLECF